MMYSQVKYVRLTEKDASVYYSEPKDLLLVLLILGPDSFPVPTYLFFKGNERLGRNDVKVAGQAGKGSLPLMQRVLVKTASGATGNESDTGTLTRHNGMYFYLTNSL